MKALLHTPLDEIEDQEVRETVQDLCQMLGWRAADYPEHSLFEFLGIVMKQESKFISLSRIPFPMAVDRKVGKLLNHGFYQVCKDLKDGDILGQYANISLLEFLKKHFSYLRKPTPKPRPLTPLDHEIAIIRTRRGNAS